MAFDYFNMFVFPDGLDELLKKSTLDEIEQDVDDLDDMPTPEYVVEMLGFDPDELNEEEGEHEEE